MPDVSDHLQSSAVSFPLALMSSVALPIFWHVTGLARRPTEGEYQLTEYFMMISAGYVVAYAVLALLLGFTLRRNKSVATGMVLVLPIATAVEVVRFPTSHNLLPFEIMLYWLPAFGIAFVCASVGRAIASLKASKLPLGR